MIEKPPSTIGTEEPCRCKCHTFIGDGDENQISGEKNCQHIVQLIVHYEEQNFYEDLCRGVGG